MIRTAIIVVLVLICALIVFEALVPHAAGVHKLTGSVEECAHSRSRCEVSWDRCVTVRWCGAVTTSSAVVLSCTAIHPLLTW